MWNWCRGVFVIRILIQNLVKDAQARPQDAKTGRRAILGQIFSELKWSKRNNAMAIRRLSNKFYALCHHFFELFISFGNQIKL